MDYTFAVITRVPLPPSPGNHALGDVWLDPQAAGGRAGDDLISLTEALGQPITLMLYLRTPVFALGEIVILSGRGEREVCGKERKPSKWDVEVEYFTDLHAAVKRSQEVTAEL